MTGIQRVHDHNASGITTPSPIQKGMVSNCDVFYEMIANDSCYGIANDHGVSLSDFYAWNPAVNSKCSGLQANEYVCFGVKSTTTGVTTPYLVQTGMVSTCDEFYKVIADD
ncbi:hypothetical protein N7513_006179 [Penicillium frequentans]|nr:hypothetical protein N7513_006179 [Penicillium glabrum]